MPAESYTSRVAAVENWHVVLLCHGIDSIEEREKVLFRCQCPLHDSREEDILTLSLSQDAGALRLPQSRQGSGRVPLPSVSL